MPARIALAVVATLIAAGFAVQIHAHGMLKSAVKEVGRETRGVKDRAAHRAALDKANRVTDLRPGTAGLFTAVGLEVRAKNLAAAERLAQRATEREPDNFSTWLTLGVVRQSRKDDAGAKAAFARADKLNPLYRKPR